MSYPKAQCFNCLRGFTGVSIIKTSIKSGNNSVQFSDLGVVIVVAFVINIFRQRPIIGHQNSPVVASI